ncbi:MAG: hypothetical protein WCH09_05815 [Bacteroidota bacterium]
MNQQELNHIIQSPSEINAASAIELIALCDKYPWFSAPHSLLAHYFARTNDFRKEEWLTRAASRIHSREWLYYFLQPVSSDIPVSVSISAALEAMAPEPAAVMEPSEPIILAAEPVIAAPESFISTVETVVATTEPNTESENSMAELSAMQIPQLELQTPVPLFQPAEEYDIAKAMGTTFNFEPVDFNDNNQSSEPLDQPKQTRPYNIEEFLSLGLIDNNEENTEAPEPIKPAAVQASEELDFFDWLEIKNSTTTSTSTSNSDRSSIDQQNLGASTLNATEVNKPLTNLDKFGLINQFIEKQPSISRPKQEFYSPERAMKRSETFSPAIVTETLANIFRTQGHFEKAIISYQKLQLKFPEKSTYFASLIEQIKKEQNQ